jgi:hypothetical protein
VSATEAPELLGLVNRIPLIWESNNGATYPQFFDARFGDLRWYTISQADPSSTDFVCEPHRLEESASGPNKRTVRWLNGSDHPPQGQGHLQ